MRRNFIVVCGLVSAFSFIALSPAPVSAQPPPPPGARPIVGDVVDVGIFYEELAPYGEWIDIPPYGWVWSPYGIDYDWRPYEDGYWVWTDYGWTWVSDEPYSWAVYHYGRWHYDHNYGWVWVPGTVWGPAWVAWREGDGFIGWAPLPPDDSIHDHRRVGNFRFDDIKRFHWSFVEAPRFCERNLRPHIVRSVRNVNIVDRTRNVTNYTVVNNTVVNNSIQITNIEKRIGRRVPKYTIHDSRGPRSRADVVGNILEFFRPQLSRSRPRRTPDVIFGRDKHDRHKSSGSSEMIRRITEERSSLQRRLDAEKAALEDRQKREAARAPKIGLSPDELRRRQQRERSAFEEQKERQQKLLQRFQDRDRDGRNGYSKNKDRKYKFEPRK